MNEFKRGLLANKGRNQESNQEWIMLQDLNLHTTPKGSSHSGSNKQSRDYRKLEDNLPFHAQHPQQVYHDNPKIQEIPKETPFNPKIITINGQTFKEVEKNRPIQPKLKKQKIPTMSVCCYYCSYLQSVPGTSELFKCCSCSKQNECTPILSIFKCGTCNSKVCYATGTSDLIKCTKCGTVNKVPAKKSSYHVEFNVSYSLDRQERETDPHHEECLSISQGGLTEHCREDEQELREYFGKQKR